MRHQASQAGSTEIKPSINEVKLLGTLTTDALDSGAFLVQTENFTHRVIAEPHLRAEVQRACKSGRLGYVEGSLIVGKSGYPTVKATVVKFMTQPSES